MLAVLALTIAVTFRNLLSADQVPAYRDTLFFFFPLKHFLAERLRAGELPLWNPWIFMGTPFLAGLQAGVFYPPSALLLLDFPLGFNLFIFVHYPAALVGSYAFLCHRHLTVTAAAIGSVTFVLGGYLVSMLNVTNNLQAAAWTPWVLLCWSLHLERRSRFAYLGLVLFLGLQLLGGAPEILLMTLAVMIGWAVYGLHPRWTATLRSGASLASALALVAMLTALQLVPTLELIRESTRNAALHYEEVSHWSMQPVSALQLLFPHSASLLAPEERGGLGHFFEALAPWISSLYLGLVPLCLAIVGALCGREGRFWGLLVLGAIVLALGDYTPVFRFLYDFFPSVVGKFRFPEKFYFLVHVAAMVLVAEGAERILHRDRVAERIARTAAFTFVAVGVFICAFEWVQPIRFLQFVAVLRGRGDLPLAPFIPLASDLLFKSQRLLAILGVFLILLACRRRSYCGEGTFRALLAGVVAADLAGAHYDLNLTVPWSRLVNQRLLIDPAEMAGDSSRRLLYYETTWTHGTESLPLPGLRRGSQALQGVARWVTESMDFWEALRGNVGLLYRIPNVFGAEGFKPVSIDLLLNVLPAVPRDQALRLLRTYSVAYLVGTDPLEAPGLEPIGSSTNSSYRAYRLADPLPRVYAVTRLRAAPSSLEAMNVLVSADFRPGREAVVEELPLGWTDHDGTGGERASIDEATGNRLTVRVRCELGCFVVLNDSHYPGWTVIVDGRPARIHRTNAIVRGVAVEPGSERVEFVYAPRSFRVGILVSTLGLLALAGTFGAALRRPRHLP